MSSELRLLLIDDDPEDRALAALVLSAALPEALIEQVDEEVLGLSAALENKAFDLVVTELGTEWARGTFLLQVIRARQPQAIIVVFTCTEDRNSAVEAMKAGAVDYLVKSSAGFLQLGRSAVAALGATRGDREDSSGEVGVEQTASTVVADEVGTLVQAIVASQSTVEASEESVEDEAPTVATSTQEMHPEAATEAVSTVHDELAVDPDSETAGEESPASEVFAVEEEPEEKAAVGHTMLLSAVESARRSVAAVPRRSMGAVLGIILILAVFSLLYASFFSGESESVEAGAVQTGVVETDPVPPSTESEVDSDRAVESSVAFSLPASASQEATSPESETAVVHEAPATAERLSLAPSEEAMPIVVQLVAKAEVWVQGTTDGEAVLDRVLQPGEVVEIGALESATLLIGNAAGLSVVWNGRDLGGLGAQGQVRRLYFTPDRFGFGSLPTG